MARLAFFYGALLLTAWHGVACAAAGSAKPAGGAQAQRDIADRILALHNRERAAVGALPLVWDDQLAASAAAYGPDLARQGRLVHSDRRTRPGQSENLWSGTPAAYPLEAMVGSWASEKSLFVPGVFPNNSRTGNWLDVSHYTTMIWPTVRRVGCALHRVAIGDFLICRYSPTANRDGVRLP